MEVDALSLSVGDTTESDIEELIENEEEGHSTEAKMDQGKVLIENEEGQFAVTEIHYNIDLKAVLKQEKEVSDLEEPSAQSSAAKDLQESAEIVDQKKEVPGPSGTQHLSAISCAADIPDSNELSSGKFINFFSFQI